MIVELVHQALIVTGFVGIMMLVIEYINVLTLGSWQNHLADNKGVQYLLAVILGASPGCLGAFAVVAMYSHRALSLGALVAAMIATSGDESFVMLAMFPGKAAIMMVALAAVGFVAGWLTDLLAGRWMTSSLYACQKLEIHESEACNCFPGREILNQLRNLSLARGVLITVLALILFGVIAGQVGPPIWNWMRITIMITVLISLFIVTTVPEHFLQEHLWRHIALKHVHRIFLWTLGALIVTWVAISYLDLTDVIAENTLSMIFVAGLTGIIPESGPHLIFTTFYAEGLIPFVVIFTSSIVQDGHGMLPLLAHSRKQFFVVKGINLVVGLAAGLAIYVVGLII